MVKNDLEKKIWQSLLGRQNKNDQHNSITI